MDRRMVVLAMAGASVVACKDPSPRVQQEPHPVAPSSALVPSATLSVAPPAPPPSSPRSDKDASGGVSVLDSPAWPNASNPVVKVTWAAYPPKGEAESETRRVELVVRLGDVVRRLPLGTLPGRLEPKSQGVCRKTKPKGEVASLYMLLGMGAATNEFAVRRDDPGVLTVTRLTGNDGHCTDDCPRQVPIATIPIPANATIVEALTDIKQAGKEAPFVCQ